YSKFSNAELDYLSKLLNETGTPLLLTAYKVTLDDVKAEESHCKLGMAQCLNKKCIPISKVCDGHDDCGDNSDEPKSCGVNECETTDHKCHHICIDTLIGYKCKCFSGYRFNNKTLLCEDINECEENEIQCASRKCFNTEGSFECDCGEPRQLSPLYPCKYKNDEKPKILYATHKDIRIANVSFYNQHVQQTSVIHEPFKAAVALDYNLRSNYLLWSDVTLKKIYIGPIDKSVSSKFSNDYHSVFVGENIGTVDGLAIDWVHDLVYWTDYSSGTLEVAAVKNAFTRTILISELDRPRAISLYLEESLMFWTQWGFIPRIEVSSQDGSDRRTIASRGLIWPNGLALDEKEKRLYWVDGKDGDVYSCYFDGSNRQRVIDMDAISGVHYQPFAIDYFDYTIYWSDRNQRSIYSKYRLNKNEFRTDQNIFQGGEIFAAKIVHSTKQPLTTNRCKSNKCSHLCLPHNEFCYVCICPTNYHLTDHGFSCVRNKTTVKDNTDPWTLNTEFAVASQPSQRICDKPVVKDTKTARKEFKMEHKEL
ncbi:low-density lipoprotein receptor-like protein, partial [Leptotrombidium deliense]